MENSHRHFKDLVYEQFGRIGKALAAPKRLELLDLLCQSSRTVESLAKHAGISVANTSQHLQVLRAARLVEAEKKGLYMEYRLVDPEIGGFLLKLHHFAESRLVDIEKITNAYFEQRGSLEPVASEELMRRVKNGEVTVLDVRPVEEFRAGHIPGALSVPISELKACLKGLPKDGEIVAYCRGAYCVMAIEAVTLLRKKGFKAQRMDQGVVEWRARGWPIASGDEGVRR